MKIDRKIRRCDRRKRSRRKLWSSQDSVRLTVCNYTARCWRPFSSSQCRRRTIALLTALSSSDLLSSARSHQALKPQTALRIRGTLSAADGNVRGSWWSHVRNMKTNRQRVVVVSVKITWRTRSLAISTHCTTAGMTSVRPRLHWSLLSGRITQIRKF